MNYDNFVAHVWSTCPLKKINCLHAVSLHK